MSVHARRQAYDLRAQPRGEGVQFRLRIVFAKFPQRRNEMQRIAEKAQVHDDDLPRRARLFVEAG